MNKLQTLGLINTTTKTQKKNGTLCFHDPIAECDYLSYSSGYVRRAYKRSSTRFTGYRTIYQLNLTKMSTCIYTYSGKTYECTERIMIPNEDSRLERLAHCASVYRKNKTK